MATMKVAEVPKPGADFRIVEREIPKPGAGQVLIKVLACGVCHSDVFTKEGAWHGIQYRRSWLSMDLRPGRACELGVGTKPEFVSL